MSDERQPVNVLIMGAAGRDFHNLNMVYRDDPCYRVKAFSAAQIPGISGRRLPPALSGERYLDGIPIVEEAKLEEVCAAMKIDQVVFSYSDISHEAVMHKASRALAAGADFTLLGPNRTQIKATVPVISVCAVRTGCGKSPVTRWIAERLRVAGLRAAVIRHPMPYGDLEKQVVQRFETFKDLDEADCTIEEREEYEPHLALGDIVYAGIDYQRIVDLAVQECDVVLWDGGNNDFSFIVPDLQVSLVDPLRPGHEDTYHPGEAVLRMADVALVTKSNSAEPGDVERVVDTVSLINPNAEIIVGSSRIDVEEPDLLRGKRVGVVEDGPTITHGGMAYGAGYVAASEGQVAEVVDPRPHAVPTLRSVYDEYPHIGKVIPAVGYDSEQILAISETLSAMEIDAIVAATPADLGSLVDVQIPIVRVGYEFADSEDGGLAIVIDRFCRKHGLV